MNNDEAKFILSAYRPDGSDAGMEMFAEALKQSQQDPALAAWFARERAHDAAVAAKLAQIAPPAGLRDAILAGAKASRFPRSWWQQPFVLGSMAAAAVLVLSLTLRSKPAPALAALTGFAIADAYEPTAHGGHGTANGAFQAELSTPANKLSRGMPIDFQALVKTGCRTLTFSGEPVLEVCFQRNGTWFHCYVVRCGDFPQLPARQGPVYAKDGRMNAVSWSDGDHRFVVAGLATRDALSHLL